MAGRPAILRVDIVADAKGVGRGIREADSAFGKLGKLAGTAGAAAAAGLAVAGAAAGAFGLAAVGAASRAEQSAGAIESVYGSAAAQVEAYAQTSASQLGLAASSYRELSSVVGSQLKNMGMSQQEAAGQSDQLIKMGADLAATFGGDVSTAVEAVGSLLRGERDPIERYGVSINQAAIDAKVASMGLAGLTGEAKKNAETQATLALLSEQTAGAMGAFGRESGTLAGAQAILGAKFEDVKARLGAGLLPILATAATFVGDRLLPAGERLAGQLSARLGPALTRVGAFLREQVVPAVALAWSWFQARLPGAFAAASTFVTGTLVPALVGLFGWLRDRVPGALTYVTRVLGGARDAFGTVREAIDRNRPALDSIGRALGAFAAFLVDRVAPVVGGVLAGAFRVAGAVIGGILDTITAVVNAFRRLTDMAGAAGRAVSGALAKLPDVWPFAAGVATGAPALTGGVGGLGPQLGQLATAAAGSTSTSSSGHGTVTGDGVAFVDRSDRRVFVTVQGALDPVAVAAQVDRLLRDHALRQGRVPYGAAS